MKRFLIFLVVLGLGFAQEPLQLQNEFAFKISPDAFSLSLESWIPKSQYNFNMWYADIPDDVTFSMQFVEVQKKHFILNFSHICDESTYRCL